MDKDSLDKLIHGYLETRNTNNTYRQFGVATKELHEELGRQEDELLKQLTPQSRKLLTTLRKGSWNLEYRRFAKHLERRYDKANSATKEEKLKEEKVTTQKKIKKGATFLTGMASGIIYGAMFCATLWGAYKYNEIQFYDRQLTRVESIADTNNNGTLETQEIIDVYRTINSPVYDTDKIDLTLPEIAFYLGKKGYSFFDENHYYDEKKDEELREALQKIPQ